MTCAPASGQKGGHLWNVISPCLTTKSQASILRKQGVSSEKKSSGRSGWVGFPAEHEGVSQVTVDHSTEAIVVECKSTKIHPVEHTFIPPASLGLPNKTAARNQMHVLCFTKPLPLLERGVINIARPRWLSR